MLRRRQSWVIFSVLIRHQILLKTRAGLILKSGRGLEGTPENHKIGLKEANFSLLTVELNHCPL